jgi:hypothetical protein
MTGLHSFHVLILFRDGTAEARYLLASSPQVAEERARAIGGPDAVQVLVDKSQ